MANRKLVVYFSHTGENYNVGEITTGNTELLAKEIVAKTGADEFRIVPAVAYPTGYMETVDIATEERNAGARPKYVGDINIADYDVVFFGYPIWWGDLPMICYTFLEEHDFSGKTVIPFNTHEGSGNAGTYEAIKSKLPSANVIGDGFNLTGTASRTEEGIRKVDEWLDGVGMGG